jgi:DNA polymerase III subunit delta
VKLAPARLAGFLAKPDPAIRAILVHGGDAGLVRERADQIARAIVPDPDDPFRVALLAADTLLADPARLEDEARALSLVPGRRLVRVREAGDALGAAFDRFFKAMPAGDSLLLVEGGELPARSSLRRAFEAAKPALAIQCYADEPDELRALVRAVMGPRRIAVSGDAMEFLIANLGGDRLLSRQELEKLALYVGDGGRVGEEEAAALVGDSAALTLEDVTFAAAEGDAAALERSLKRAFEEGEQPVTVLRAEMRHFQRLFLAGARKAAGASDEAAIEGLRPRVFYKLTGRFKHQMNLWPPRRAAQVLAALLTAERHAKSTGLPGDAICRDALLRIARGAALVK